LTELIFSRIFLKLVQSEGKPVSRKFMNQFVVQVVRFEEAQPAIEAIRHQVFHLEQGVALTIDFDGLDATSMHLLATEAEQPIGTARIRMLSDRLAKIERVAVLASHRGLGLGKALMHTALSYLEAQGVPEVKLNAQAHAKSFYEKLGFIAQGKEFDEAGILHVEMRRSLQHPQSLSGKYKSVIIDTHNPS
jgi:predicted GNAT family N-acyltransferase